MGLFDRLRKTPSSVDPVVGAYGKHPSNREFLRLGDATARETEALDRWLQQAMAEGERLVRDGWSALYAGARRTRFLVGAGPGRCLLGALGPSSDAAGRRFPFALFGAVDARQIESGYPAAPHNAFLRDAELLLERAHGGELAELQQQVSRLRPPGEADFERARATHERFVATTDCTSAFSPAFAGAPPGQHERALTLLRTACWSISSTKNLPRYGIRCPLDPRQPAATAGLWLALLRHETRVPLLPSALWDERTMVIYFGELARTALLALWQPGWKSDQICDLLTTETRAQGNELFADRPLSALLS